MNEEIQKRIMDMVEFLDMDTGDFNLFLPVGARIIFFDRDKKTLIFEYAGEYCRVHGDEKNVNFFDRDYIEKILEDEIMEGISLENFARSVLTFPRLFKLRKKAIIFERRNNKKDE